MNHIRWGAALGALGLLVFGAWLAATPRGGAERSRASADAMAARDDAGSVAAFREMLVVIRNPRCMNCHSTGDFPRQGDDGHPHAMNVRRGPDGKGVTAEKCSTCHQDHNLEGMHLPPGAPNWHLPPRDMPMIWQGLTDRGICEQLKDPARNGHRTMEKIVEHFTTDKLVAWGWNPGPGRAPVPMSKEDFAAKVKEWASKGAACPAE
jgi:cytochrome c5